jgi:ribosomal subunit interface protein
MKINITSRHFKAHETLQNYIKEKLEDLNKYDELIMHADVILAYNKPPHEIKHCEIILKLRDKMLTAKEKSDDFTKSFDLTFDKIETQLQKHKDKHKKEKYSAKEIYKTI